jgi:hypothetical protein
MFVNLFETMNMLSVQCFQYLCITTLYLFTGITLVNKMEQLERKIEAVESRKDQIMYQTHFLVSSTESMRALALFQEQEEYEEFQREALRAMEEFLLFGTERQILQ